MLAGSQLLSEQRGFHNEDALTGTRMKPSICWSFKWHRDRSPAQQECLKWQSRGVLSTSAEPNSDHSFWMTHHFLRGLMKDRALPNRLVFEKYGPQVPVGGRPLRIITLFRRLSSVCAFSQRKYVRLISVTWDTEHVLGKNSSARTDSLRLLRISDLSDSNRI